MGEEGFLEGLRVLDASTFLSGPMAGRALADLGAEVTKVEPPDGDAFSWFPPVVDGVAVGYLHATHGKRVVHLDLKSVDGRARLDGMLADADVLLTNWRPGVAEGLGLSAEGVRSATPGLVWCRISGFGQDGPGAALPAFDTVVQARAGLAVAQGGAEPALVRSYLADKVTAMMVVQAVLAAIHRRDRTDGQGAVLDVAMLDALSWFSSFDLLLGRTVVGATGETANRHLAASRPVRTADGWVVVAPVRARHIRGLTAAVGHPEWLDELRDLPDTALAARLFELLDGVLPAFPSAHWVRVFADADVPTGEVLDLDGHLADPQVAHNRTYRIVDDPRLGPVRLARYPVRPASTAAGGRDRPTRPEAPGRTGGG